MGGSEIFRLPLKMTKGKAAYAAYTLYLTYPIITIHYFLFITSNREQIYLLPGEFEDLNYLTSFSGFCSLVILSQLWLPTVQLVLQADWQVDLHSPQAVIFFCAGLAIVLIILYSPLKDYVICLLYYRL